MYVFSKSWQSLSPWAMVYGIVFSTFVVTRMFLIADHSSSQNRATVYGLMNITWSIGGLIGPTVAGLLVDLYNWSTLFYVASFISFLSIIPTLFLKENSEELKENEKTDLPQNFQFKTFHIIVLMSLIQVAICTGMGIVSPIMPLYLTNIFNVSKTQVGLFLSLGVGVSTLLMQVPSGILADRFGRKKVMLLCALITPMLYILSPFVNHYFFLLIIFMMINASWSMTWPSSMAYLIDNVPQTKRSIAIGARQTAIRLGFTLGPLIGGYLWHLYELGRLEPTFPFFISALAFGLSLPGILLLKEKKTNLIKK
jgi:MFS family permease